VSTATQRDGCYKKIESYTSACVGLADFLKGTSYSFGEIFFSVYVASLISLFLKLRKGFCEVKTNIKSVTTARFEVLSAVLPKLEFLWHITL
jgi:hypothetical protein